MLYSYQASLLFVHVSRTGGISIQKSLKAGLGEFQRFGTHQHAALSEARGELGELFDSTLKFAMVRNPWDRLVSWYSYITTVSLGSQLDPEAIASRDAPHWKEFDGYLASVLKEQHTVDGKDRPSMSQFHLLSDARGNLLTDRLGRFENLVADFSEILAGSNLRCPPLPKLNQSSHLHYSSYYSDKGRKLVEELLEDDINHFEYQFEPVG